MTFHDLRMTSKTVNMAYKPPLDLGPIFPSPHPQTLRTQTHTHTHTHLFTTCPNLTNSSKPHLPQEDFPDQTTLHLQSCLAPAPWLSLSPIIIISLLISPSVFPPDCKLLRVRTMSCSWLSLPGPVNRLVHRVLSKCLWKKQIDEFPSLTFIRLYFNI